MSVPTSRPSPERTDRKLVARKARIWKGARTPQALKRVRQALRRRAVNRRTRSAAKTLVQHASNIALGRDEGDAAEAVSSAITALDKAAEKGIIHRNNAARRKSRLMKTAAVHVAPALLDYVQALLAASRSSSGTGSLQGLHRGLSPRAGLLLVAAARAWALLEGRPMVLPEDIHAVFPAVAGHRLAGSTRAGAPLAQSLLRSVTLP